jgi:hypothetical protein
MNQYNNIIIQYSDGVIHRISDNYFDAISLCATAGELFYDFENKDFFKKITTNSKMNYNDVVIHDDNVCLVSISQNGKKRSAEKNICCIWIHPILAAFVAEAISLDLYKKMSSRILFNFSSIFSLQEDHTMSAQVNPDKSIQSDELAHHNNTQITNPTIIMEKNQIVQISQLFFCQKTMDSTQISNTSSSCAEILKNTNTELFNSKSCTLVKDDFLMKPIVQNVEPLCSIEIDNQFDQYFAAVKPTKLISSSTHSKVQQPNTNKRKLNDQKLFDQTKNLQTNTKKQRKNPYDINYYVKLAIDINNKNITGLEYNEKIIIVNKYKFYDWYCSLQNNKKIQIESLFRKFAIHNSYNKVCSKNIKRAASQEIFFIEFKFASDIYNFGGNYEKMNYLMDIMNQLNMCETRIYTRRDWGFVDVKYFNSTRY